MIESHGRYRPLYHVRKRKEANGLKPNKEVDLGSEAAKKVRIIIFPFFFDLLQCKSKCKEKGRKQPPEVFYKKLFLKISQYSYLCWSLQHSYFPVNIVKFLSAHFEEHLRTVAFQRSTFILLKAPF